ncbi:MAG TPA: nuclear transport factor 2 family protein [Mycobacteriales bacterium]|nr:nuclear transport factor 2 family protein [Mycobacteriales bacterium]
MSADENLATAKSAYAAFAAGDIEGASAPLADDIEWIVPGNSAVSGVYRGKDEVLGFWGKLASKGFTTQPEHLLADDERVVVLASTTADGQQSDSADVLTFRDGKLVKFQTAVDTALQEKIWGTK